MGLGEGGGRGVQEFESMVWLVRVCGVYGVYVYMCVRCIWFVCVSVCECVCVSVCDCVGGCLTVLSVCLFCLSVCLPDCLFVCLSVCLSCLSVSLSVFKDKADITAVCLGRADT